VVDEETIMEMTWLETIRLLGLDLLAGMILILLALDLLEHALHSAWQAARAGFRAPSRPSPARTTVKIGAPRHV
jgi:hypothetical protein